MSKCGDGPIRVTQMTACPDIGWRVVFVDTGMGRGPYYTLPVACWLLVMHGDEEHIHPAVALATAVSDATLVEGYVGVASPGENPMDLVEAYKQSV